MTAEASALSPRRGRAAGVAAILLTMFIYAGNLVAVRYSVQHGLSAWDLVAMRYAVAGAVLLPLFFRLGLRDLGGLGWRRGITLAIVAGSPYMIVFIGGLRYAPAAHGAVLNPGVVPSVVFVGMVLLGLQRFSAPRLAALAMIVIGLMLVTAASFSTRGRVLLGDAMLLATGISWGGFTLLTRLWNVRPLQATTVVSVLSLVYLPFYVAIWYAGFESVSWGHVAAQAVFQGLVNSIGTLWLVTYAVHALGPQQTALYSPLVPLLTTALAIPLLGERPTPTQAVGILIVVTGMFCAGIAGRQEAAAARAS